MAADDLVEGDGVYLIDGSTAFVTGAELEKLAEPIKVYNLEVADFNTYFVGDEAVLVHNYTYENGVYENADYHTQNDTGIKNRAPSDGQAALDNSLPIGPNTNRRIGISNGEFVVLDNTIGDIFHGHVRSWDELTQIMQAVLRKAGLVTKKGKIL